MRVVVLNIIIMSIIILSTIMLNVIMLSVIIFPVVMLSVVMLSVILLRILSNIVNFIQISQQRWIKVKKSTSQLPNSECHFVECRGALHSSAISNCHESCCAEYHNDSVIILSAIMLNVIMLGVIIFPVVMLSVVMLRVILLRILSNIVNFVQILRRLKVKKSTSQLPNSECHFVDCRGALHSSTSLNVLDIHIQSPIAQHDKTKIMIWI
jgi:hypothetical protein